MLLGCLWKRVEVRLALYKRYRRFGSFQRDFSGFWLRGGAIGFGLTFRLLGARPGSFSGRRGG